MQYAWPVWPCQLELVTLHRTVGTEFGNPDSSLIMPDFDLSGELSLKIELHMLRPITEKVHSGNGPVSLVRGTNHSLIPHNHVSYAVSSPVRQYASSISYATASHTKWMVTRPVWWDVRFIVTLWTPFSSFIHSFNQISWVWFVGDVFLSLS